MILPNIDQGPLYNFLSSNGAFDRPRWRLTPAITGDPGARTVIQTFLCPSDPMGGINTDIANYGKSNYKGVGTTNNTYVFGNETANNTRIRDITDGTSNTMMVGESTTKDGYEGGLWIGTYSPDGDTEVIMVPTSNTSTHRINGTDAHAFSSTHEGGAQFLFADGKVQFISENINGTTYSNLGAKADDNPIGDY